MPEPEPEQPKKYDIEGLKKMWPKAKGNRLDSVDNPSLNELMVHGPIELLAEALVAGEIPYPWNQVVYTRIPPGVMLLAVANHFMGPR